MKIIMITSLATLFTSLKVRTVRFLINDIMAISPAS